MWLIICSHFIFHDWPDSEAEKILAALKPSMKQGYSKLLIHDVVLDPLLPSAEGGSSSDIIMMAGVSASERECKLGFSTWHN